MEFFSVTKKIVLCPTFLLRFCIFIFFFSLPIYLIHLLNSRKLIPYIRKGRRGAVASWLVRSTPEQAVRFRALAGDIVLCSWARHFTLTVPLSTKVYKWVAANLMLGVALRWTSIPPRKE